jgi:thioredoxin reductase
MPGDEIDGRGIGGLAAAAQAAEQGLEGHIALALSRIGERTAASTMQAMQFDHARWLV